MAKQPVNDPGSILDHIFRLAAAIRAQQWGQAFALVVDIFQMINTDPAVVTAALKACRSSGMAAGDTSAEGLASRLEALAGEHGGQPASGKLSAEAVAKIDWAGLFSKLLPLLLQILPLIVHGPEPAVPAVQT